MNQLLSAAKVAAKSDHRPIVAFAAMLASVMLICQGYAVIGLPAFAASIVPFVATSP